MAAESGELARDVTTVALAIVSVATIAVIVSKNSNTAGVVNSGSSAFNTGLATAEGPVTGYSPGPPVYAQNSFLADLALPQEMGAGFATGGG